MAARENLELAKGLYQTLEENDIPAFLELCAEDAVFEYPAENLLPYGGRWRGREEIARFLDLHDEAEEILDLDVRTMVPADDGVLVLGRFQGRAKPSGRTWETSFVHALSMKAGRLERWQAYFDSAVAVEAHRPKER